MAMLKIKKGDTVKVIAGKDKDKEGKVTSIFSSSSFLANLSAWSTSSFSLILASILFFN